MNLSIYNYDISSSVDLKDRNGTLKGALSFSPQAPSYGWDGPPDDVEGVYYITYVEIDESYRGQGYYKQLLQHAFTKSGVKRLISFDRVLTSNPIYAGWLGIDENELGYEDHVSITLVDNKLKFELLCEIKTF